LFKPVLILPSVTMTQLTEEELELQKKYAILRKHKKILSDLKKQRKESMKSSSADGANKVSTGQKKTPKEESKLKTAATPATPATPDSQKKRPAGSETVGKSEESEKTAEQRKEEAKRLVAKGLIKINPNERKKQEFKRSRNLERRLEDPDKSVNAPVEYTPFSAASEKEDELKNSNSSSSFADMKRKMGGYDNFFVKSGDRREREATAEEDEADLKRRLEARDRERESERDRRKSGSGSGGGGSASSGGEDQPPPSKKSAIHRDDLEGRGEERKRKQKGNTVFVKGHGLSEDVVRTAFERFGKILNLKMDSDNRNNWFVTYLEQNDAATAIRQMDTTMVSEIHLHVALARHQVDISGFLKNANLGAGGGGGGGNSAGGGGGGGAIGGEKEGANKKAQDWTTMASSTDHKSEHEDKRALITYDIDDEIPIERD